MHDLQNQFLDDRHSMTVVDADASAAAGPVVSAFDVAVLWLIAAVLVLSLFSLCFILHLCFKSRTSRHLRHFNSLWTVRSLLVLFIALWSLSELLRLPLLRRRLFLHRHHQALLCKLHVALSLGFLEPAFLVTLLFLVDVSVKKDFINGLSSVTASVFSTCSPLLLLQILVLFFSSPRLELLGLPYYFWSASYSVESSGDASTVLCSYPLLSTAVFGSFGVGYSVTFLFSAWRVVSMVINKALRVRIHGLVLTVLVSLPVQVVLLVLSVLWSPGEPAFDGVSLAVFLSKFACAVAGEGILVIKPIADSLIVWRQFCTCPWDPWRRPPAETVALEDGRV
ncbi:hypothetical protein TIFTF001_013532 [Ficus carica]|uniref:Uncharacterized protein n=1 Tax=Ficus carica TaxID=3494 RepID=A0AA87ZV33_FICCA|nr:hypothetical protein TIFTF001_013532 [Ficus carica]